MQVSVYNIIGKIRKLHTYSTYVTASSPTHRRISAIKRPPALNSRPREATNKNLALFRLPLDLMGCYSGLCVRSPGAQPRSLAGRNTEP